VFDIRSNVFAVNKQSCLFIHSTICRAVSGNKPN